MAVLASPGAICSHRAASEKLPASTACTKIWTSSSRIIFSKIRKVLLMISRFSGKRMSTQCRLQTFPRIPMQAVGFYRNLPLDHNEALQDIELPTPELRDFDLLVEVKAVSVNPVDTKIRAHGDIPSGAPRIAGWDAAGIVRATGPLVSRFKPGDRVWYAGDITRPGSNSELHAVDERIVGPMPRSLDFAEA